MKGYTAAKLFLSLQLMLFASFVHSQKALPRSLPRVTTPREVWEHIKLRSVDELKEILKELDVPFDSDMEDDELREHVYDEEVMETWLKKHPEEILKLKPENKKKEDDDDDEEEEEENDDVQQQASDLLQKKKAEEKQEEAKKEDDKSVLGNLKNIASNFFGGKKDEL